LKKTRHISIGSLARTPPSNNSECNDGEKSRLNFEQLDANTIMFKEAYNIKSLNLLASLEDI
jgi:hypothetical protein